MLDTFKARLKVKLKTLGVNLSQTRIDAIADRLHKKSPEITEEKDHDDRIDELNELSPFSDLAKLDDKVRTLEAKTKGQSSNNNDQDDSEANDDSDKGQQGKGSGKKKNSDEPPSWFKPFADSLSKLTTEKVQTSLKGKAADKLKDVPEKFYAGRALPDKEEDLDGFVDSVKNDYTTFKQDLINQGLMSASGAPAGGNGGANVSDKALDAGIDAWVKSKEEPKDAKK